MTSDKAIHAGRQAPESTSGKSECYAAPRLRGRQPAPMPDTYAPIHAAYVAALGKATILDEDTRRAYASRVRDYLI